MEKKPVHVEHPFPPVWDGNSETLILGSFPSVKSREEMFFYGHPRNRFWAVISAVLDVEAPVSIEEKRAMLLENHIALWDVIASCRLGRQLDKERRAERYRIDRCRQPYQKDIYQRCCGRQTL